jgi:hypothetical protein
LALGGFNALQVKASIASFTNFVENYKLLELSFQRGDKLVRHGFELSYLLFCCLALEDKSLLRDQLPLILQNC